MGEAVKGSGLSLAREAVDLAPAAADRRTLAQIYKRDVSETVEPDDA